MRRLWMGAAAVATVAACRAGGTNDRALGTERRAGIELGLQPPSKASTSPERGDEPGALAIARVLAMTQAMHQGELTQARLVKERAASLEVRGYAGKIESDHQRSLEAMDRLAHNRRIDLDAAQADPLIKAKRAAHRETIERLSRLSGQALDGAYMAGQTDELALLSALAREGEELSKDNDLGAFFRMIGERAHDQNTRALAADERRRAEAAGPAAEHAPARSSWRTP